MSLADVAIPSGPIDSLLAEPELDCPGDEAACGAEVMSSAGVEALLNFVSAESAPTLTSGVPASSSMPTDPSEGVEDVQRLTVRLDRTTGTRLGIDVETGKESAGWDDRWLLVRRIQPEGLVPAWNVTSPDSAIIAGDRIVQVNGIRNDAEQILAECTSLNVLELEIERPTSSGDTAVADADAIAYAIAAASEWSNRIDDSVAQHLRQEVLLAKTATEVVKICRRDVTRRWSLLWAAQALRSIHRKSTDLTRREWMQDRSVVDLAGCLERQVDALVACSGAALARCRTEELEEMLVALESLRRLQFQTEEKQDAVIACLLEHLADGRWGKLSAGALARVVWLAAPLRLWPQAAAALRELRTGKRFRELARLDMALIVEGLRRAIVGERHGAAKRCRRNMSLALPRSPVLKFGFVACETFRLSFDVIPHGTLEEPTTLLRVDLDSSGAGDGLIESKLRERMPVIYFVPGTTRLLCALGPHGKLVAKYYSPEPGLTVGQPSRVTIRVGPTAYTVTINGEESPAQNLPHGSTPAQPHASATSLPPLKFLAGDDHYGAADASIAWLSYRPLAFAADAPELRDSETLLRKLAVVLGDASGYAELTASELVGMAEALDDLEMRDDRALRGLGQEISRRKRELAPDEVHRVHVAFQQCKMPLNKIWEAVGVKRKRQNNEIHTLQVFTPESGHGSVCTRKPREHEVERVSPPRKDIKPMKASC